jgi:diadenosine tetraphosphate (Ap4A) HIT family hydrolase
MATESRDPVRDCLACDVVSGRTQSPGGVIYENDWWMLDHSVSPVLLAGFFILKPKRHVEHIAELDASELASFGPTLGLASQALTAVLSPQKVYACSFGEMHKHVHIYLVPRTVNMPSIGPALFGQIFDERRWTCSDDEAAVVAEQVRRHIAKKVET